MARCVARCVACLSVARARGDGDRTVLIVGCQRRCGRFVARTSGEVEDAARQAAEMVSLAWGGGAGRANPAELYLSDSLAGTAATCRLRRNQLKMHAAW